MSRLSGPMMWDVIGPSLEVAIQIYTYIYVCICIYICVYLYIARVCFNYEEMLQAPL